MSTFAKVERSCMPMLQSTTSKHLFIFIRILTRQTRYTSGLIVLLTQLIQHTSLSFYDLRVHFFLKVTGSNSNAELFNNKQ